jgi:hypothetical protein
MSQTRKEAMGRTLSRERELRMLNGTTADG